MRNGPWKDLKVETGRWRDLKIAKPGVASRTGKRLDDETLLARATEDAKRLAKKIVTFPTDSRGYAVSAEIPPDVLAHQMTPVPKKKRARL
jgi:hypothetical protein